MQLMPFQESGVQFLLRTPRALLADEMGLGKTVQALAALRALGSHKVLIVCPATLKLNWLRELERWCPGLPGGVVYGSKWPEGAEVVIINYEILQRHKPMIDSVLWDALVLDEAHYCMNQSAQRTRAIFGSSKIAPVRASRVMALTGTPVLNRPYELYPLLRYLAPREFPDPAAFGWRYCGGIPAVDLRQIGSQANRRRYRELGSPGPTLLWGQWLDLRAKMPHPESIRVQVREKYRGASNLPELCGRLKPFMLRRTKAEVLPELPEILHQWVDIEPPPAVSRGLEKLTGAGDSVSTLRRWVAAQKIPAVLVHLHQALAGGKVVAFVHHQDSAYALAAEFGEACTVVRGGMSPAAKQAAVDRFQTDPTCQLFVGTLAAAEGITLTASSHVVIIEPQWGPAVLDQMAARCHRIGQGRGVLVQYLAWAGSLDDAMHGVCKRKAGIVSAVVDGKKET